MTTHWRPRSSTRGIPRRNSRLLGSHGRTWYWEHCGIVDDVAYMKRWDEMRKPWYPRHGYGDRLVVTRDAPGGVIESASIELEIQRIIGAA